jgi:hypothetical protein
VQYPPPRVFLQKSAQALENKRQQLKKERQESSLQDSG